MLTPRQNEIVHLMLNGFPNKEIATELNIAMQTVKNQVHRIYTKLGVHDRDGLINFYSKDQE